MGAGVGRAGGEAVPGLQGRLCGEQGAIHMSEHVSHKRGGESTEADRRAAAASRTEAHHPKG